MRKNLHDAEKRMMILFIYNFNFLFLVCEDDLGRVCQIDVRDRRMNRQDDFENDEITYIISFFDLMT